MKSWQKYVAEVLGTFILVFVGSLAILASQGGDARIGIAFGFGIALLAGLYAFGAKGLIAGPVILSLVLSAYRIYRYDILRWRHEEEEGASPAALADATLRESTPALRSR